MVSPVRAQQHPHGQPADGARGMMGMMQGSPEMMTGLCGVTTEGMGGGGGMGMMGSMTGAGMVRGGPMGGHIMAPGMMPGGMPGLGMAPMGMMNLPAGPGLMLRFRETLDLSDAQVGALNAIEKSAGSEVKQQLAQASEARRAATEALQGDTPDLNAYEMKLREAADHMVQASISIARAGLESRRELTSDQTEKLRTVHRMMNDLCSGGAVG